MRQAAMLSPPICLIDKQHLLSVAADADGGQHRDVRGLAVQPRPDHGAIENEPDDVLLGQVHARTKRPNPPSPCARPADDVLADGALEQAEQRALTAACWCRPGKPPRSGLRLSSSIAGSAAAPSSAIPSPCPCHLQPPRARGTRTVSVPKVPVSCPTPGARGDTPFAGPSPRS